MTRLSRGRLRPPVGWASVFGAGTIAGIGFTVSILIATLVFHGRRLEEAKLGTLTAAHPASVIHLDRCSGRPRCCPRTFLIRRADRLGLEVITDLAAEVDPERDHIRGPMDALR